MDRPSPPMSRRRNAQGGKSIYGASVGILMLDARFPRIPGDMGNARTWPFPVLYRIVRGATPDRVVRQNATGLLDAFIAAARDLVADGAEGITTNCGFLSLFQDELAEAVGVPVATSSLMQTAIVNRLLPRGKRAGILTISGSTLTPLHLEKAAFPPTRRSARPKAAANSPAPFSTIASSSTSTQHARTTSKQRARWFPRIRRSARLFSNART